MDASQVASAKGFTVLQALFHHLCLGLKLPQQRDPNHAEVEACLFRRVLTAVNTLRDLPNNQHVELWSTIGHCIALSRDLHTAGRRMEKTALLEQLEQLEQNGLMILHIDTQNAGLLVYTSHHSSLGDCVIFETFEASARNEDVLATENALLWDFPGAAAAVPLSTFRDKDFVRNLATFLEKAAIETPKTVAAHVRKAGAAIFDHRYSVDPSIVTSLLVALIEQVGAKVSPVSLRKRVRDDICRSKASPWRRLPLWLVLRVGIERHLSMILGGELGRLEYKFFIATILAQLLSDAIGQQGGLFSIEEVAFLKTKLCRRLVKLNMDAARAQETSVGSRVTYFHSHLIPIMDMTISRAGDHVNRVWEHYRQSSIRFIPKLARRARSSDTRLRLRASHQHLMGLYVGFQQRSTPRRTREQKNFCLATAAKHYQNNLADRHFKIARKEQDLHEFCSSVDTMLVSVAAELSVVDQSCTSISRMIAGYTDTALKLYTESPEQKSTMLLTVMELWMVLDKTACMLYPLLTRFHPVFCPETLDCLLLPSFKDMVRVRAIQRHMKYRIQECGDTNRNIFDDPHTGCFAQVYVDESPDATAMHMAELRAAIESQAEKKRSRKLQEWARLDQEYRMLSNQVEKSTCVYLPDDSGSSSMMYLPGYNGPRSRQLVHDPRCQRCESRQRLESLSIRVYEDPLPIDTTVAKAVTFELLCPQEFASYRDAVWRIFSKLSSLPNVRDAEPRCELREYSELRMFTNHTTSNVCMASTTKSFLTSHYAFLNFPVDREGRDGVCRPNGLRLTYFDRSSGIWPGRVRFYPNFQHHVKLVIPPSSPFSNIPAPRSATAGLTSYEIMASQPSCPVGLNLHEFLAFQTLLYGNTRRWPTLLTELGSANLNFSSEATMVLVNHIALECGPLGDDDSVFRTRHSIFQQSSFCEKLLSLVEERLVNVAANWRETHMMDTVIVLLLRVAALAEAARFPVWSQKAVALLEQARGVCLGWFMLLRQEILETKDSTAANRCQQYAMRAALLCKKTFAVYLELRAPLGRFPVKDYVLSSITAHDNLVVKIDSLPKTLQEMIVRDFKTSCRLYEFVRDALFERPDELGLALKDIWPGAGDDQRRVENLKTEDRFWLSCVVVTGSEEGHDQTVHFDCVQGTLLVNGQPVGKLPKSPSNAVILDELFGNHTLLSYPSPRPGMQHVLCVTPGGFQVHVGQDGTVVHAYGHGSVFHFVHRNEFRLGSEDDTSQWDLPGTLIHDCVHWLDLNSGKLYLIPKIHKWPSSNVRNDAWVLDLRTKECAKLENSPCGYSARRLAAYSKVVDVSSPCFNRISRIFTGFEDRANLLVTQPEGKRMQVMLPRFQLLFFVNDRQLLQSPHLQCEIGPEQDAGTWYGFRSMIVCRSLRDSRQRSILAVLGDINPRRDGCHMIITASHNENGYARFAINNVLGRVDCAAEPLLVYTKAVIHAFTSSILPDSLTGKTGTEEALVYLKSGICQPWSPLNAACIQKLQDLAKLTPTREYYPADARSMMTTHWKERLTVPMQHDGFRPLVDEILVISADLSKFYPTSLEDQSPRPSPPRSELEHLRQRAETRRRLYERPLDIVPCDRTPNDRVYEPRDRHLTSTPGHSHVMEVVNLLEKWPTTLGSVPDIAEKLSQCCAIRGFFEPFDKVSLSDRLNADILQQWGPLVRLCQQENNRYTLMFTFAPLAFGGNADVSLICCLLAFSIFDELREIRLPQWSEYLHYRPRQNPTIDYLLQLIEPFRHSPPDDDTGALGEFASAKNRKRVRDAREAFVLQAKEDCELLAKLLLNQWPCFEPKVIGAPESLLVDAGAAVDVIGREWRRMYQNKELSDHLSEVQLLLAARLSPSKFSPSSPPAAQTASYPTRVRGGELVTLAELIRRPFVQVQALAALVPFDGTIPRTGWTGSSRSTGIGVADTLNGNADISIARNGGLQSHGGFSARPWSRSKPFAPKGPSNNNNNNKKSTPHDSLACIGELYEIVEGLAKSTSSVRQQYAEDLTSSIDAFRAVTLREPWTKQPGRELTEKMRPAEVILMATNDMKQLLASLKRSMAGPQGMLPEKCAAWLQAGQLWPACGLSPLLELLSSTYAGRVDFGSGTRDAIIRLGLATTRLQWGLRLLNLLDGDSGKYAEEEKNKGHTNWAPGEHPNWLLLEIETNLLIRPDQVQVALATIAPASGKNSVLQMNMGQGKTSCIIPMAVLSLANGRNLVRVSVPKALLQQTAQLLQSRLGGLLNRTLAHIPFSRRTLTSSDYVDTFIGIHKRVHKSSGIMLCQPEHNLSFMLSGLQTLLDNKTEEGKRMIQVHEWLTTVCRDILDESDYTLAVRTQLIYPSGSQMALDGHPHRWQVVETLLRLVNQQLDGLSREYPQSIEVIRRSDEGFPMVFFLRRDVEEELIRRLTGDVLKGNGGGVLPLAGMKKAERAAVKEFISSARPREKTTERIRKLCPDRPHVKKTAYLLRGLLVHRILMMTLKKRWNVQYGLPGENRDPISVPYTAKGVPSTQAEWGHPEVAILFTCLSFYYEGISVKQLRQALESVLKSDDPSTEYDKWTHSNTAFPDSLKAWNAVNLEDDLQLREIWGAVRYSVVMIDYFLNNFVFPCHAKQFKVKLQSNGWDIPLLPLRAAEGAKKSFIPLSTGFSGTNDNRAMLPLNIKQEDLSGLSHTNAEVLTYLLRRRSRLCVPMARYSGKGESEIHLLKQLKGLSIRVLIDAGAQILEMDNKTLATEWLKFDGQALGALYFDKENRPWIVDKMNRSTSLLGSPFADDLSQCLVYLDEAHTRGTDLKLPSMAVGALTLGLGQAKDHTVQAAMRLRQLGTTQAVTFLVPPEVLQSIADLRHKTVCDMIDSRDVVHWLLDNTCEGIEQLQPLYYSQGIDYCRRMQAGLDHPNLLSDPQQQGMYVAAIKRDERQSLQQLYDPTSKDKGAFVFDGSDKTLSGFARELNARRKAFQDTGRAVAGSALCEVEVEREVAFEVESVRHVKKPTGYPALCFPGLHKDLESFARTGRLAAGSQGFSHMITSLSKTGLGRKHRIYNRSSHRLPLFVSNEFDRTVRLGSDITNDTFIRPVNWVLWSKLTETAIIVIPEEAELIIPMVLKVGPAGPTHLLTYSAPVARKMLQFNDFGFFNMPSLPPNWTCPPWLRLALGVYAGRLYFSWEDYAPLCDFLGIDADCAAEEDGVEEEDEEDMTEGEDEIAATGTTTTSTTTWPRRQGPAAPRGFVSKPRNFMQEFLAARRRGQDFVHTPMGFVTHGKYLHRDHAFFRKHETNRQIALARPKMTMAEEEEPGATAGDNSGGLNDMGANVAMDPDIDDDDIEYEESELESDYISSCG